MSQLIEPKHVNVLSALMARSNMGHGYGEDYVLKSMLGRGGSLSVEGAVDELCGQFSETVKDENDNYVDTLTYFYEEAHGWQKQLAVMPWETFETVYVEAAAFFKTAQLPLPTENGLEMDPSEGEAFETPLEKS